MRKVNHANVHGSRLWLSAMLTAAILQQSIVN